MASVTCPQNHGVIQLNNLTVTSQSTPVSSGSNVNLVDLGKKLLDASRNGETEEVKSLMQSGAPFTTDWLGTSPLHFAAQFGHTETAEVLLRAGISRDARTKVDRTPLHVAAQEGHLAIVSLLIMHGADVDARDMLKMTPLHWALVRGHVDVAECLLNNGADVNACSKFEKTPIDIAYDYGRMDIVPMLQKYVGVPRHKPEPKQSTQSTFKMRPTVLPNKSHRTAKLCKNQPKPSLFLPSNLTTNWQKAINLENIRKLFSVSGDNNSLNIDDLNSAASNPVLATLAALAGAASSNTSSQPPSQSPSINSEAASLLQWLETNGISMNNSQNDSNLFQSAIDSGQTISLTEAGKLALNFLKDQSNSNSQSTTSNSTNKNSKVITIVADSAQLPQIINSTQSTPIVVVSSSTLNQQESNDLRIKKGQIKITKTSQTNLKNHNSNSTNSNVKHVLLSNSKDSVNHIVEIEKENQELKSELELTKKQLEEYKQKYLQKEKEALLYKKQLEELRGIHH